MRIVISKRRVLSSAPVRSRRSLLEKLSVLLCTAGSIVSLTCVFGVTPAIATKPWLKVTTNYSPASISPGGEAIVTVKAVNLGNQSTAGPIVLSDLLPAGLKVREEEVGGKMVPKVGFFAFSRALTEDLGPTICSLSGQQISCQTDRPSAASIKRRYEEPPFDEPPFDEPPLNEPPIKESLEEGIAETLTEEHKLPLAPLEPYEDVELRISVKDEGVTPGAQNVAEVKGGGASAAILKRPVPLSESPPSFGAEDFAMVPEEEGGDVDAQAGSHPYQLTNVFALNQSSDPARPPALPRDLKFNLPPGLVGNATILPQCSDLDFRNVVEGGFEDLCPADTAVGVASVTIFEPVLLHLSTFPVPLFNLTPGQGEPARFGFEVQGAAVTLDTSVRTGSDYGITVSVNDITQLLTFRSSALTFWGVPGDKSHDSARGWSCLVGGHWTKTGGRNLPCIGSSESHPPPFLTMPSSCALPFQASVEGVSWTSPSNTEAIPLARTKYSLQDQFGRALGITGCNQLAFAPSIEARPDLSTASTPTGLSVHVRVPQEVSLGANGLASSSIKDTIVTLPEGVHLNPSGADGLEACSESQIGFSSVASDGSDLFTPDLPVPFCPDASKIGTVEFKVPVIAHPLTGSVYLATQGQNPFGSLVAMYVVAKDPVSGVLLKLAGEVKLSETGQVTTTFANSPQAPLEEATFSFFGGARAPLSTPSRCGAYVTRARFTPWSETPPVSASSTFNVTSGPNGGPCPNPLPFAPTLEAGMKNVQAGAFSALTTTISREDGNQDIQTVQLRMPPGLSGVLAGIPLCPEAQANAGSCSSASEIGKTIVSVGLGGDPFTVTGGQVFLTAPYEGAPFGLSIVNPAKAGPFDLGKVIVRARIEVDPHTAALTVTTDPIPHVLQGIPLQIKHVNVTIDRPGFTFNPTNCSAFKLTGSIGSVEGANAPVEAPFQIANCAALKFAPKFSVSTAGKTSKAKGASLAVKLTYPKAPPGTYANLTKAKVSLPKQLPTRLTTIQKACTAAVFAQNPANCPADSVVGHAKVITPILPVPLIGPAYFVSHGGEAFPDLTIVLQGYGVSVDLVGSTQIKNGITTNTFKSTPDVPFDSFELNLPEGKFSALAANANLCKSKLAMPTEFVAQNGAVLNQSTPIAVTGCARPPTPKQQLAKAMKACKKKQNQAKRSACERAARKRFGGKAKGKKTGKGR
jgi:hypothetical protein